MIQHVSAPAICHYSDTGTRLLRPSGTVQHQTCQAQQKDIAELVYEMNRQKVTLPAAHLTADEPCHNLIKAGLRRTLMRGMQCLEDLRIPHSIRMQYLQALVRPRYIVGRLLQPNFSPSTFVQHQSSFGLLKHWCNTRDQSLSAAIVLLLHPSSFKFI